MPRAQVHLPRHPVHPHPSSRPLNQTHRMSDRRIRHHPRLAHLERHKMPRQLARRHLKKSPSRLRPQPDSMSQHRPRRINHQRSSQLAGHKASRLISGSSSKMHNQLHPPVGQDAFGLSLCGTLKRPGTFHPWHQMGGRNLLSILEHFSLRTSLQSFYA